MNWGHFIQGKIYNRQKDIHGQFGGQQQGGICTPSQFPVIIIFTGDSGNQHGYVDGWTDMGTYRYFGEGQLGNMEFVRGNKAIRDHIRNGKDLLVFQTLGKRKGVRFLGQFFNTGYEMEEAPDTEGKIRKAIVFELVSSSDNEIDEDLAILDVEKELSNDSLSALRKKAFDAVSEANEAKGVAKRQSYYIRSQLVRTYVIKRSGGICEGCSKNAPFVTKKGNPYLEPHHIRRLSDGGLDRPDFMIALCPNCHREVHSGAHGKVLNSAFQDIVKRIER